MSRKTNEIIARTEKFFQSGVPRKNAYVTLIAQYNADSLHAAAESINDLIPHQLSPAVDAAVIVGDVYGRTELRSAIPDQPAYESVSLKLTLPTNGIGQGN